MFTVSWIEIPVLDIDRAVKFYQTVFEIQPDPIAADGTRRTSTLVHNSATGPGVSLTEIGGFTPANKGTWVYFYVGEDVTPYVSRVEAAGGKILTPKTTMGVDAGNYASIEDSEGNVIALYSTK